MNSSLQVLRSVHLLLHFVLHDRACTGSLLSLETSARRVCRRQDHLRRRHCWVFRPIYLFDDRYFMAFHIS